jgi:hypothetical protein
MTSRHHRPMTRRRLLTALCGAVVAGPTISVVAPYALATGTPGDAAPQGPGALPLTVVNATGSYGNASVHLYVVGNRDGRQVRVTPDGALAPVSLADNGPDGFTDYAIPLAPGGSTTLNLPYMSGRIYVALGDRLRFRAVADGNGAPALQYPAGWVASDPSYQVLHDCAEFTYDASGMYCNATMVDMFSVPMTLRLTGAADQTTGALRAGGRAAVFDAVRAVPEFARLAVDDLRVVAPGHGLDAGLFPAGYFDAAVDRVWDTYAGRDLTVTTYAGDFTGRVRGDRLAFTGPAAASFARPSTRDVLFCDGALAAPNDGTSGPVAAVLGAGFNRSTLLASAAQPAVDPAAFYRDPVTNHYAAAIHAATADGKAYGFAFDDVAGFASYVQDPRPVGCRLTLGPL